jgi:alkane 1-monooxygenase
MTKSDFKYLIAYIAPLAACAGLYLGGWWSFGVFYIAFGIIPFLEMLLPSSITNHDPSVETARQTNSAFDWLLYSHVPILFGILIWAFYKSATQDLSLVEEIGLVFNLGTMIGAFGINVGHELGHRNTTFEQNLSKWLLLPALYQHFFIEHNLGHHKNVATDEDPASARFNENIYAFWWRSVKDSYLNAWRLEQKRLEKEQKSPISWQNQMVRFTVYQLFYLLVLGFAFDGIYTVGLAVISAIFGFLLLETVNYIEHYGLRRQQLSSGKYEPVLPKHSWNSDHELGRIFLYELTRHSDHHYKSTRKYQVLRHFDESPQLPFGYPLSMWLSLLPPAWFAVMNKRVQTV